MRTLLKKPSVEDNADQKQIIEKVKNEIEFHKDTASITKWDITKEGNPTYVQTARSAAIRKLEEEKFESETENMLQKFHHLLEPNPRAIKRLLNTFVIYRAILIMQGIDLDFEVLALWIILMMRWPLLSDYISRNPQILNRLSDGRLSDFPEIPEKFKLLFHSEDFRRVISGYRIGKKLNEKAIRQIAQL